MKESPTRRLAETASYEEQKPQQKRTMEPERDAPRTGGAGRWPMGLLRRSELLLIVYFAYVSAVALLLPLPFSVSSVTVALNFSIIGAYILLGHSAQGRSNPVLNVLRDWMPLGLIVLAYRQMGWFAPPVHTYELESRWVVWDTLLLNGWGLQEAIESLGVLIPSILELSYTLVYAIGPFSVAMLYFHGRRSQVDRFLFIFLLGTFLSYALFPYFPSEPPRTVYPGQHFPTVQTIFRQFNWWLLGGYGIHTSVFPSAHVSSAYAAAFGMIWIMPRPKWIATSLLVLATLIFVSTVYGRYHYAVDGLAGLGVSLAALGVAAAIERTAAHSESLRKEASVP